MRRDSVYMATASEVPTPDVNDYIYCIYHQVKDAAENEKNGEIRRENRLTVVSHNTFLSDIMDHYSPKVLPKTTIS